MAEVVDMKLEVLALFQKVSNQLAAIEAKGRFSDFDENQLRMRIADFRGSFAKWATLSPAAAHQFERRVRGRDIWQWLSESDFELLKYNLLREWDLEQFND